MGLKGINLTTFKIELLKSKLSTAETEEQEAASKTHVIRKELQIAEVSVTEAASKINVIRKELQIAETMNTFCGLWTLVSIDNFDAFMKKLDVGFNLQFTGNNIKNDVEIGERDNGYLIKIFSTFKNTEIIFELNKEVDETTIDGRLVKTIFTLDGYKLLQTQKETTRNDKNSVIIREILDDRLVTHMICEDVTSTRTYDRVLTIQK